MATVTPLRSNSKFRLPRRILINNRWVEGESGRTFATVNLLTGEKICQIAEADSADVEKAVKAARNAFEEGSWRKMRASDRGACCIAWRT
jgi:aldehyde dehydrogenase (NAD+)